MFSYYFLPNAVSFFPVMNCLFSITIQSSDVQIDIH